MILQSTIAMGTCGIWLILKMVMIGTEDGSETGDAKELVDYKTIMQNEPRYIIGIWDETECIKDFTIHLWISKSCKHDTRRSRKARQH